MPIAYLDGGNLQLLAKGLVKSDRVLISVANCPKLEETLHAPLANPDLLLRDCCPSVINLVIFMAAAALIDGEWSAFVVADTIDLATLPSPLLH